MSNTPCPYCGAEFIEIQKHGTNRVPLYDCGTEGQIRSVYCRRQGKGYVAPPVVKGRRRTSGNCTKCGKVLCSVMVENEKMFYCRTCANDNVTCSICGAVVQIKSWNAHLQNARHKMALGNSTVLCRCGKKKTYHEALQIYYCTSCKEQYYCEYCRCMVGISKQQWENHIASSRHKNAISNAREVCDKCGQVKHYHHELKLYYCRLCSDRTVCALCGTSVIIKRWKEHCETNRHQDNLNARDKTATGTAD